MSSPSNLACPMTQPLANVASVAIVASANAQCQLELGLAIGNIFTFSHLFMGLPFLVDDASIIGASNSCAQDTFFAPCANPLILAGETHKKVFQNLLRLR